MPVYEYRCRACGDTFDRVRPMADADVAVGCDCGSDDVARLPSRIAASIRSAPLPMAGPAASGTGCCGGACGCG